ncbi:hypothetical protein [Iodobacter fluviatilis]|uniref:Uncharacterized protein n=1 Tax=Iodobacter fluviatilis TaxID=537 RepID=A0A377QB80_9NEIS|nr:hypothetical protein [Iodobacter fluviatilis]TCU81399.1 hypothetical protein EV682_12237 [Iodobacter fluviatilis]STQ91958.1 Uncharacterised protein [Iodobacter fluviatilis]
MAIDWNAVATIASPVIALFVGVWVDRLFESRSVLISYFSHVSAFRHTPSGGQPLQVHTHSVVLRNAGRKSATNVRLHHSILPEFNIWPVIVHNIETLPDGSQDILIPTLVPGEEITVSYLYFPPVTAGQVNAGVKCDQGFANQITVLLQRQFPRWFNRTAIALFIVGVVTVCYLVYVGFTVIAM